MFVIPAIDHAGGRLARMDGGSVATLDAFDGDPMAAARSFVADGAEWLHVVDLDLAFSGDLSGIGTFTELSSLGVPVQASGGIRTEEAVRAVLSTGVARVVLGSAALSDPRSVERLVSDLGERLVIGLEVANRELSPRGAPAEGTFPELSDVLDWLPRIGVSRVVLTAVASVGTLAGPDEEALSAVADTGIPLVLAGGVATLEDVTRLAHLEPAPEAVIVGRAIYEGGLSFREARAAAEG